MDPTEIEDKKFAEEKKWRENDTKDRLEEGLLEHEKEIELKELKRRLLAERLVHAVQIKAIEVHNKEVPNTMAANVQPEEEVYKELLLLKDEILSHHNQLLELEKKWEERENENDDYIHRLKEELEEREETHSKEKEVLLDQLEEIKDIMSTLKREKEESIRKHKEEKERLMKEHEADILKLKDEIKEAKLTSEQLHIDDTNTLEALQTHLHDLQQERDNLQGALLSLHQSVSSLLPLTINGTLTPPTTEWTSPVHLSDDMTTPINHTHKTMTANTGDSGLEDSHQKTATPTYKLQRLPDEATPVTNIRETTPSTDPPKDDDDNLTILSINSTSDVPAGWDLESVTPNLHSVQDIIPHLYRSVSHLVNSFLSSSTQALQYQDELAQARDELSKSEVNLNTQLRNVTGLQEKIRSLEEQLMSKEMKEKDLTLAEEKISSLITEVELMHKRNEEEREVGKEKERIEMIEEERNTLTEQLKLLQKELLLSQKERVRQREMIKSLQEKQETFETNSRKEIERLRASETKLTNELRGRDTRIRELECLPQQLVAQQQKEEELQETIHELNKELTKALHTTATIQSATQLQSQLEAHRLQSLKEKENYNELRKVYEENITALKQVTEELEEERGAREQIKAELLEANGELEEKEQELEKLLVIRNEAQEQCDHLNTQIQTLTDQVESLSEGLRSSNEHVSKLCKNLEEKEREVNELMQDKDSHTNELEDVKRESQRHLKSFEKSAVQLHTLGEELNGLKSSLSSREKEVHSLTISNASLEEELKVLRKKMSETEEYHQLESQHLRNELSLKVQEMTKLHEQQTKELEEKLKAEHAGQMALLRIEIKELSEAAKKGGRGVEGIDEKLLQKIADITPVLERDANEVLQLCSTENSDLQKANEAVQSLKERNAHLQKELSSAESSLLSANETLLNLKAELLASHERIATLEKQMSDQATQLGCALAEREKEYKEAIEKEKQKRKNKHESLTKKYSKLLKTHQSFKETSESRQRELSQAYKLLQDQLKEATSEATKSNKELEDNKGLAERLLEQLEAVKGSQVNSEATHKQQLEALRQALEDKENELSELTNNYLEERLRVAQMRGENSSLLSRMNSPEKSNTYSIRKQKSDDILEQEKASLQSALQSSQAEVHRLSGLIRIRENRVKALIFQKHYLTNEVDAFFHTNQAALLMIQDMGGLPWQPPHLRHRSRKVGVSKFRRYAVFVCCAMRLRKLAKKQTQHKIKGYIPIATQIKQSK